jgi:hypothetical protein
MKIGRKALLVLGAVVIVAAIVVVGVLYFRQAGERSALNDKIDAADARWRVLNASQESLLEQLASAQLTLEESRSRVKLVSVESIECGEYLFDIADECNVALDTLVFPRPAVGAVGAVTYSVVSLTLPVTGTLENIFDFINTIRTDARFASTNVRSVNMNIGGSKATIILDIYGYKG